MLVRAVWTEQEKALRPEEQNLAPLRNFLLLVKTQFPQLSPSLQCSSPHHFRYHWHMEDFRYTYLFGGVKPGSSWTRGEGPAAPVTAATSGGTRAHVCCTPRRWDRAGGMQGGGHIRHVTAADILLHLRVQPAVLYTFVMGVWRSQPSLAGDTCLAPGALGVRTPCMLLVLLRSLPLLAQGPAPCRALGAHVPLRGHWPRCSSDISRKCLREPGHGALKTQTVLAQNMTAIAR